MDEDDEAKKNKLESRRPLPEKKKIGEDFQIKNVESWWAKVKQPPLEHKTKHSIKVPFVR